MSLIEVDFSVFVVGFFVIGLVRFEIMIKRLHNFCSFIRKAQTIFSRTAFCFFVSTQFEILGLLDEKLKMAFTLSTFQNKIGLD